MPSNQVPNLNDILNGSIFKTSLPSSYHFFLNTILYKIHNYFPEGDPTVISSELEFYELNRRMNLLRKEIYADTEIPKLFIGILQYLKIPVANFYSDLFRLRCVPSFFHTNERAKSVSYLHRDPWYANPQCQLNFWIPLTSVKEGCGFGIYPGYFEKSITNDSDKFDYSHWLQTGGFQANSHPRLSEKVFPKPIKGIKTEDEISLYGEFGDVLLFSSHHLHGTQNNTMSKSRFTLEIRFVLSDWILDGKGPKNVDNYSKGSTLFEMKNLLTNLPIENSVIWDYVTKSAKA